MTRNKHFFYLLIILILITIPWFNSDSNNIEYIPKISQEQNPFFEINPCKISLVEYFLSDTKSLFQDHYYFRPDHSSSIKCFGRITGISIQENNLETQFFISVGTNSLVGILLQSTIWIFLLSLLKRKNEELNIFSFKHNFLILLTSYLLTFSIYSQQRFYEDMFYIFDLNLNTSYFLLFMIFFFITKNLIEVYLARSHEIINLIPFIFLVAGIFSGYNLVFFSIIFIYSGFESVFSKQYTKKYFYIYLALGFWWLINSNGSYSFKPGKFRGFTNSVYEFNANLFWIIFFGLVVLGIINELRKNLSYFDFEKLSKSFSISSMMILILGLVGSNFPSINFFSSYFLGLQRNIVELTNPFAFDEFGVKISWRGISPSSETIGEFFGLCLILNLFAILLNLKLNKFNYLGVISSAIGLYFSDNRTSIVLVFLIILFHLLKGLNLKSNLNMNKNYLIIISILLLVFSASVFFRTDTYEFFSSSVLSNARANQFDSIFSSYLLLLNESFKNSTVYSYIFGFLSFIGFLLNRSEMWGIFFARYNPTYLELLIGSGPLTFGQLYGEIKIEELESFLLPHSSLLSYLVFFGIVPIVFIFYKIIQLLKDCRSNTAFLTIFLYIFLNIIKNDSLNYFSVFYLYASILFFLYKTNLSKNFFKTF